MEITITKRENLYKMNLSYNVPESLEQVWNLLATDSGFARWFPQLRVTSWFLKWKTSVKLWTY